MSALKDLFSSAVELLALVVGELLDVDVERLGPQVVLVVEAGLVAPSRGTRCGARAGS